MVWAGPYCGRLLAGLGATVVKIEAPDRPDGTRFSGTGHCSGTFGDLNRGKASLVIDLAASAGRDVFLRLARGADVVLENHSPRVMPNFGLSWEALSDINPSLLMLSLPAFGSTGPWASYVAYGSGLELATGLASRRPLAPPAPASVPYLDYLAGAYGAVGVLAALIGRDGGRGGVHVEIAQREVACQVLETVLRGGAWRPFPSADAAVLTAHPQLAALGFLATAPADSAICYHYARPPWQLQVGQIRGERPAPIFGADSVAVLAGLARIDSLEIERLVRDNVIRTSRQATGGPPDG
ncbi:MAG TPA: CoA transferase, partial [bacterium]|nr:CoA transferase [bacterium]